MNLNFQTLKDGHTNESTSEEKKGGVYLSFAAVIKRKWRNGQRVLSLTPEGRSSTSYN